MSPLAARPRVLVFAYACEPGRGSEPAAGWGMVRALATFAECVVLVGPEHTPGLRRWEAERGDPALTFVEVPEPSWARFAIRHRVPRFLVYLAWLRRAHRVGGALHAERRFDAASHVSYSTYWLPAPAVRLDVPCVWGPVGGAVATPLPLWPALGWRGALEEVFDLVAVYAMSLLPGTRRTWRRAAARLVQNEETRARLPAWQQRDALVLNHALFTDIPPTLARQSAREPVVLFAGLLEPRKGARLALRALVHAEPHVRLLVVGDGPERRALERLARRLGVAHRVEFAGWRPRQEVLAHLGRAAAAVFTGLREEGGIALAEAMLTGTPVIVLANGGARTIAESTRDPARVALIPPDTVEATARRIGEAMTRFCRAPATDGGPLLDQRRALDELRAAFDAALDADRPREVVA